MTVSETAATGAGVIRVAVVDDHPVVREGTAALLAAYPGIEVVGTAESLATASALLAGAEVDVLLLDIRLGTTSGLHLLAPDDGAPGAGDRHPAVLVLTAYDYPQYAEAALRLGAAGFVLKTAPMDELIAAIRRVAGGGLAFDTRPDPRARVRLSARELEVLRFVADGRSNDEVGVALGIGSKTVESHLARLYERFGLASRTELVARALREGWLDLPPGT